MQLTANRQYLHHSVDLLICENVIFVQSSPSALNRVFFSAIKAKYFVGEGAMCFPANTGGRVATHKNHYNYNSTIRVFMKFQYSTKSTHSKNTKKKKRFLKNAGMGKKRRVLKANRFVQNLE